ncbi:MAG: thioredoxin family protein [Chloroflexi bacterium]|nr:thioredoxin family protein [Chloroflexota bacterium]
MEIKTLGMGCPKCHRLEQLAREAASEMGVEATFTRVREVDGIMAYAVMSTPALVINGEVKSSGHLPRKEQIVEWLRAAQSS